MKKLCQGWGGRRIGVHGKWHRLFSEQWYQKKETGADPSQPEEVEAQVEPFFQQAMGVCVEKIVEGDEESQGGGGEEQGGDDDGYFPCDFFLRDIEKEDKGQLNDEE